MNTKKAYELIQNILSGLPERSKQSVLNKLFSNEKSNADSSAEKQEQLLEKCRQSKMVDGKMVCPDCGSLNTIRNGWKSGRQRYLLPSPLPFSEYHLQDILKQKAYQLLRL